MASEDGAATVEWTALVLLVSVALGAAGAAGAAGTATGAPGLARAIRCALLAGCRGEDRRLEEAYGTDVAAVVRAYAPNIVYERGTLVLPVDYRGCRRHRCADAADARGQDVWRSTRGRQATVFTHVVDRRGRGGDLFVQYWLYYPDSTYFGPAHRVSRWSIVAHTPLGALARRVGGHHADDWESYEVRVRPDGTVLARASAHRGYAGRRRWPNVNELPRQPPVPDLSGGRVATRRRTGAWTSATGWTRVSRGSHAGHLVDGPGRERRTDADGLVLVPIERLPAHDRATGFAVAPPWDKPVYADPGQNDT
jgi:hypothetical protein